MEDRVAVDAEHLVIITDCRTARGIARSYPWELLTVRVVYCWARGWYDARMVSDTEAPAVVNALLGVNCY